MMNNKPTITRLISCIVFLSLARTMALAQEFKVPNGIYSSLNALANEQALSDYTISYKKAPDSTDRWVTLPRLKISPKLKKSEERMIWGFSDGKDFYINSRIYDPQGSLRFTKLLYKGKELSIFTAVMRLALPHQQTLACIDMQRGQMFVIDNKFVKDVLQSNPDLQAEYLKGPRNRDRQIEYLIKYDELN